jgi:hypothetical protein
MKLRASAMKPGITTSGSGSEPDVFENWLVCAIVMMGRLAHKPLVSKKP